jgi:hypothetical protein
MDAIEIITKRLEDLIRQGKEWVGRPYHGNDDYYLEMGARGWPSAAVHLTSTMTLGRGPYFDDMKELTKHPHLQIGVPKHCVEMALSTLEQLRVDLGNGLLRQIEDLVSAENFDNFLNHAEHYHRGGYVPESGVLVAIVFEDALRKLARKHELAPEKD